VHVNGNLSTREVILDTAERLFAEQGIFAVSNRRIAEVAEVADGGSIPAAGFRFGSKADLVRAITRRFTADVEWSRQRSLRRLDSSADLRQVLGCMVLPWTERFAALGPRSYFARVCAQAMNSPVLRPVMTEEARKSGSLRQTIAALDKFVPGKPGTAAPFRSDLVQHAIVFVCAERERAVAEGRPTSRQSWADETSGLIDALTAIITASLTDVPPWPPRIRPGNGTA
jgi:AcrR family transcriptional regulator